PAVGGPPGEGEHARLVRAEPDTDVMRGRRATLGPVHLVELAVDPDSAPLLRGPDLPDDRDGLSQGLPGLARPEPTAAHGLDRVPERARAQAELGPAAAEQIQAGGRAGQP